MGDSTGIGNLGTQQIRLIGPFRSMSGYSKMARAVLHALIVAGYEVEAVESDWNERLTRFVDGRIVREKVPIKVSVDPPEQQQWEVEAALARKVAPDALTLAVQLPGSLAIYPSLVHGPYVGWTMTESDNLCAPWKHGMRHVDMLLSPSSYCQRTFERVIPEVPSMCVPIPVDERLWSPDEYVEEIAHPRERPEFVFLSIFNVSERKNWRPLMLAFAEEFAGEHEVGLIVKPGPQSHWGPVLQMADWCRSMGAWVRTDTEKRTDWSLGALYRACNVYVQPASEGFGLPYVEAALCGKPSIALSLGGAADVVTEETGYLVPSFMAPIPGHHPDIYPRDKHNFATCDIDDLKKTLRRAYEEERAGADKGTAARNKTLESFTCKAIAPLLRNALECGKAIHAEEAEKAKYPARPRWATACGAWGDTFACIGNIRAMMADKEIEQIGIIWYGKDMNVANWLAKQPWCREVISLVEPDQEAMSRMFARLSQSRRVHGRDAFKELLARRGVEITGPIAYTQLCLAVEEEPTYWRGAVLPEEARQWADEVAASVGESFILLQPVSIASNKMVDHWPFWSEAMTWLLDRSAVPVVLVSEKPIEWPEHPRLHNWSGKSRSMADVLALAEIAAGVVSTSNNLGIYAPISEIESVIVCARTCGTETFYHRWQRHPCISLVDFEEPLSSMQQAVEDRFPHLLEPTTQTIEQEGAPV